ncbi:MAG: filamentous hemagglutinin N-terminal domain-containing protein, partial [Magnetococcales bacterium]|nr:filamentous hemagglutinin N-terminal domain-containing protein [Magnetococcales bacterium]
MRLSKKNSANSGSNMHNTVFSKGLRSLGSKSLALAAIFTAGGIQTAQALPQGAEIKSGQASINSNATKMTVTQTSNKAIIDWRSFGIKAEESVNFDMSASATVLNRVTGNDMSKIFGKLQADGTLILVNANGILFGKSATVDVGNLVATTADINNADFLSGNMVFNLPSSVQNASVINKGNLSVKEHGFAALVAPTVSNSGVIQAQMGQVVLGGADTFTMDFYGDGLMQFELASTGNNGSVDHSGLIAADGGKVLLSAATMEGVVDNVINMDGIIEARAVEQRGGEIILSGGNSGIVSVTGSMDVSGAEAGQTGGTVIVEGEKVGLFGSASIDASGAAGGGTVKVGGGLRGADSTVKNAKMTYVGADTTITVDATMDGDGGKAVVWADGTTRFHGAISAQGAGNGDGGFVEVSGKEMLTYSGEVNLSAENGNNGTLLLDPQNLTIENGGDTDLNGANNDDADAQKYAFVENEDGTDASIDADAIVTALATGNVILQADDDITVDEGISSNDNTSLTLQAGDDITVNSTITMTGTGSVSLQAGDIAGGATPVAKDGNGDITVAAAITTTTGAITFSTESAGSVSFADDITTAGGNITLSNNVELTADTTFSTGAGAGDIQFDGTIVGKTTAKNLTVDAGTGSVTLSDTVGSSNLINEVNITGAGGININGGSITSQSIQNYNSAVTLGADTLFTVIDDNIAFDSTISGATSVQNLTVSAGTGSVTLDGAIGGSNLINTVSLTGTAGININGSSVTSQGAQDYNSAVVLGADTTFTTTDANVTFDSTVSGVTAVRNFTVAAGTGAVTLSGAVGGSNLINAVNVTGSGGIAIDGGVVTSQSTQDYNNAVTLGADTTLTAAGNITMDSTVAGSGGSKSLTLDASTAGTITVSGAVSDITTLTITQSNGATFADSVTATTATLTDTEDGQTIAFQGDTTLTTLNTAAAGYNLSLTGSSNTITDAFAPINTGTLTIGDASTDSTTFVSTIDTSTPSSVSVAGTIQTAGTPTLGDLTLTDDTTLIVTTGDVTLSNAIQGSGSARSFTVNANNGALTVTTAIAGTDLINNLDLTASNGIALNNGSIVTTGTQDYNSAITLGADTTLTAGGNIAMDSTVTGSGGSRSLTLDASTAGTITVGGAVSDISTLTITQSNGATFADSVAATTVTLTDTEDGQTIAFQGDTTLTTLNTAAAGYNLSFTGSTNTITDAVTLLNTGSLTLGDASTDSMTFSGLLDASATSGVNTAGTIQTGGATTLSAVTLADDTTLTATTGDIAFGSTIQGSGAVRNLTATATNGALTIAGIVGGSNLVNNLDLTASNGITLNGGTVTTQGTQDYNSAVNLGADTTFTAADANVAFDSTISGVTAVRNLTVNAGTGSVTLDGAVGGSNLINAVDITGTAGININGGSVTSQSTQDYN